jgi:hypothetical protein
MITSPHRALVFEFFQEQEGMVVMIDMINLE